MPPGFSGLGDKGSGASRVHRTKPSGRGAPEATPRLNGLPFRQLWAPARRITPGAAIVAKPAPPAATKRRRLTGMEVKRARIGWPLPRWRLNNIFVCFYDILKLASASRTLQPQWIAPKPKAESK